MSRVKLLESEKKPKRRRRVDWKKSIVARATKGRKQREAVQRYIAENGRTWFNV